MGLERMAGGNYHQKYTSLGAGWADSTQQACQACPPCLEEGLESRFSSIYYFFSLFFFS